MFLLLICREKFGRRENSTPILFYRELLQYIENVLLQQNTARVSYKDVRPRYDANSMLLFLIITSSMHEWDKIRYREMNRQQGKT